ncbi:TPA: hypothetical protein JA346_07560 [Legionella pneumophila]|nr:hypothetical protein [Legionella pneumophila]HAT8117179.1 hypothetical protein [Legionella pneumophila]HAT8130743.1 hypothetical protein [Legionella pneumophila]HAT8150789.1 hypothetical protein [Legionella pneumophila]HAT8154906.1 hypothetical protein [Legionella pneumophila]
MKEKRSKTSKYLSNLVLILALSMMVSSAVISYFFIRQNELLISSLKMQAQNKQILIKDVWNNIVKKETRADIAILLSVLPVKDEVEVQAIKKDYLRDFSELTGTSSTADIVKEVKKEIERYGEYIDNLYLDQVTIQNKATAIEGSNKLYSEIAFFLQIFSVVLIILRKDFTE